MQNRQGNDQDSQYQTGVYYTNKRAREMVKYIAEIERDRSKNFLWSSAHLKTTATLTGAFNAGVTPTITCQVKKAECLSHFPRVKPYPPMRASTRPAH